MYLSGVNRDVEWSHCFRHLPSQQSSCKITSSCPERNHILSHFRIDFQIKNSSNGPLQDVNKQHQQNPTKKLDIHIDTVTPGCDSVLRSDCLNANLASLLASHWHSLSPPPVEYWCGFCSRGNIVLCLIPPGPDSHFGAILTLPRSPRNVSTCSPHHHSPSIHLSVCVLSV